MSSVLMYRRPGGSACNWRVTHGSFFGKRILWHRGPRIVRREGRAQGEYPRAAIQTCGPVIIVGEEILLVSQEVIQ